MDKTKSKEDKEIYERLVRNITKGRIPASVRNYISKNKMVINERILKAYCWNHGCRRFSPCVCKVSIKSTAKV